VYGTFIYGLDEDTLELPAKLEAFIEETGIDVPGINLLRIPLQEFIPSYTALTKRDFTVQNALKRAMRAPRLRSAVLMFNLLYVHMYGIAHKDLMQQLGELGLCCMKNEDKSLYSVQMAKDLSLNKMI
jgi:hypothetical protein